MPIPDPEIERQRRRILPRGDVPSPMNPPAGYPFHPRCPEAIDHWRVDAPRLVQIGGDERDRLVSCHLVDLPPTGSASVSLPRRRVKPPG